MTVLVRLTEDVDAWGETFPAGTEMMVVRQTGYSYEVAFPTMSCGRMCVGTITRRVCEEVPSADEGRDEQGG